MSPSPPRRASRTRVLAVAAAAAFLLAATAPRAEETKPAAIPPEILNRAADIAYSREVQRARAKRALDTNRDQLRSARHITEFLILYAPRLVPDAAGWSWEIHVQTRDEPMAWCMPRGRIMLSTGLVDRAKLTPPEVGVVLAHVIAHSLIGRDETIAAARLAALRESPDPNRRALQLADILGNIALSERHDQEAEREADAFALELMARAGVDPRPAVDAWRKIARAGGATPPGFLSLHATWPGRLDEIGALVPQVLPLYEQARAEQAAQRPAPPVRTRRGLY
jgi:Zn-dependent protease with chaperone function